MAFFVEVFRELAINISFLQLPEHEKVKNRMIQISFSFILNKANEIFKLSKYQTKQNPDLIYFIFSIWVAKKKPIQTLAFLKGVLWPLNEYFYVLYFPVWVEQFLAHLARHQ